MVLVNPKKICFVVCVNWLLCVACRDRMEWWFSARHIATVISLSQRYCIDRFNCVRRLLIRCHVVLFILMLWLLPAVREIIIKKYRMSLRLIMFVKCVVMGNKFSCCNRLLSCTVVEWDWVFEMVNSLRVVLSSAAYVTWTFLKLASKYF